MGVSIRARIAREDEVDIIELSASAYQPVLEIGLVRSERESALLATERRDDEQIHQMPHRLARDGLGILPFENVIGVLKRTGSNEPLITATVAERKRARGLP